MIATTSCSKLIEIDAPQNSIVTEQTFKDSANADAAIQGLYAQMINKSNLDFGTGVITVALGLYTDELALFAPNIGLGSPYFRNNLLESDPYAYNIWKSAYALIYHANASIEGLQASIGISENIKNSLKGEALVVRAFTYYYLINLFGNVPWVTSSDWKYTQALAQTPVSEIRQYLINDLKNAKLWLPNYYRDGRRNRAVKWTASALLSRFYLTANDFENAEKETNEIIGSELYSLNENLDQVFFKNNSEAIWQLSQNTSRLPFTGTIEGVNIIPLFYGRDPTYYLPNNLLESFEPNDIRRRVWVDSTISSDTFYYPYKYKVGLLQGVPNGEAMENYMVIRFAEVILNRAEALANQNKIEESIVNLNLIRKRADLPVIEGPKSKEELLKLIYHERKIELFAEWGNRFFDLKRWGTIDEVLPLQKPNWGAYKKLLPIPSSELGRNPSLVQNTGYN